jgi:hypothetical protein
MKIKWSEVAYTKCCTNEGRLVETKRETERIQRMDPMCGKLKRQNAIFWAAIKLQVGQLIQNSRPKNIKCNNRFIFKDARNYLFKAVVPKVGCFAPWGR